MPFLPCFTLSPITVHSLGALEPRKPAGQGGYSLVSGLSPSLDTHRADLQAHFRAATGLGKAACSSFRSALQEQENLQLLAHLGKL